METTAKINSTYRDEDSPLSRLVESMDALLKTLTLPPKAQRTSPTADTPPDELNAGDACHAGNLMRVNHAGEIAAQGLYYGQAFVARSEKVRQHLLHAAEEETDHLAWCDTRLRELGTHPSVLTPVWLLGSFAIGVVAGAFGDKASLSFVEETEHQVKAHLESHDAKLPANDHRSRAVLAQLQEDEARHARQARDAGGDDLPIAVTDLMRVTAKVMTTLAQRL